MTTYKGNQAAQAKHASSESGNTWHDANKVTITANLTTADEAVLLDVPAGVELTGIQYRAGDLDTGTTLVANLGYRSTHADQKMAAVANAFLSASAAFQAAQASWVDIPFDPVMFTEPGQIVLKPTVNGTGLSGTPAISIRAFGKVKGVV